MSNTESPQPNLLEEFVDFAMEKNISVDCPACRSSEGWNLFSKDGTHQVIPGGRNGDLLIGAFGIDVLTMRCRNCGFIRAFDLGMVRKVAKQKRENSPESGETE